MSASPIDVVQGRQGAELRMVLFVAGEETNSGKARNNLDRLTEELEGRCTVEVVDVLSNHNAALRWKILLTPALLVFAPGQKPVRITGNLDESKRVIAALGLRQRGHGA